mgnify:CR=1 FL=1
MPSSKNYVRDLKQEYKTQKARGEAGGSDSDKAKRIAENRVAAGFHWPSDVTAGVVLAQALLKHVKMNETIKDLVAKAATEWPQR